MPPASPSPDNRRVVLVDADDNALGVEGILACHLLPGRKHRAFTAIVLDATGHLVLARRAPGKMLWHGYWDATVASHPHPDEGYAAAGERRVREELGADCTLHLLGRFEYRVAFEEIGAEDEVCAALVGRLAEGDGPRPDPLEVDAVRLLSPEALMAEFLRTPHCFCPWLYLALLAAGAPGAALPADLAADLAPFGDETGRGVLRGALAAHLPDEAWHFLDGGESAA